MKIGIVEDHRIMLEAYKIALKDFECVIEAFNGREMIDKIEELNKNSFPDLLIVNINMPIMNGFEAIQWLKSNHPNIKIVVVSSLNDDDTILRMIKLGANSYLIKSEVTYEELNHAISEVIKNGSYYTNKVTEIIVKSFQNSNLTETERKILTLTEKEITVINLICEELSSLEIAERLDLSPRTVETFTQKILSKLNVKSRVGIAIFAERHGLLI